MACFVIPSTFVTHLAELCLLTSRLALRNCSLPDGTCVPTYIRSPSCSFVAGREDFVISCCAVEAGDHYHVGIRGGIGCGCSFVSGASRREQSLRSHCRAQRCIGRIKHELLSRGPVCYSNGRDGREKVEVTVVSSRKGECAGIPIQPNTSSSRSSLNYL